MSSSSSASRSSGRHRPGATPAASAISSRTPPTSSCRRNRSRSSPTSRTQVGHPIDFWPDGYLFLLSSRSTASRRSSRTSRCSARTASTSTGSTRSRRGRRSAPGSSVDGVLGATYCGDDGIADPNGVTHGLCQGGAGARRRDPPRRRSHRHSGRRTGASPRSRRPAAAIVDASTSSMPPGRGRARSAAWPASTCRSTPERRHIFIAQPPGGGSWDDGRACRGNVPSTRLMVIDFESTFYFHREGGGLLFGMGDPDEQPGFDTTVQVGFPAESDRGRGPAAAGARRRRGLTCVGGTLRDDAGSQSDHRPGV